MAKTPASRLHAAMHRHGHAQAQIRETARALAETREQERRARIDELVTRGDDDQTPGPIAGSAPGAEAAS